MSQPDWECIAQLGDASPLEYGGYWVFRDKTGVYCEEAEYLEVPDEDDENGFGERHAYRFTLDRCTYINGVLSCNKYHPDYPAWFASLETGRRDRPQDTTYLSKLSDCMGVTVDSLIEMFCSEDPIQRAQAYWMVGQYHCFDNLDGYPLVMRRRECKKRYGDPRYTVVE